MPGDVSTQCPLPAGLRAYIVRGNDMVPLIPVDQLPFQLQGIPRRLTHRQMSDENWKLLQETDHPSTTLSVQKPSDISSSRPTSAPTPRFLAPDHRVRNETMSPSEDRQLQRVPAPQQAVERASVNLPVPAVTPQGVSSSLIDKIDTFASIYQKDAQRIGYRAPYPSGIQPDPSKKVFCDYWIRTGECSFTAQGCKYKHEMPTIDRLREIGFTQVPRWYKEKSAITTRGQTWMQRRLAVANDDDTCGDNSCPRVLPDPSPVRASGPELYKRPLRLAEPAASERAAAPSMVVPSPPASESGSVRDDRIYNLLIDLRDSPMPLASPPPSESSSTGADAGDAQSPIDHISTSPPPPSPAAMPGNTPTTKSAILPSRAAEACKHEGTQSLPARRSRSVVSWSSDSEKDAEPVKSASKREKVSRRAGRRLNQCAEQHPGMANSKHAPFNGSIQASNAGAFAQNARRKLPQYKNSESGEAPSNRRITHPHARKNANGDRRTLAAAVKQID